MKSPSANSCSVLGLGLILVGAACSMFGLLRSSKSPVETGRSPGQTRREPAITGAWLEAREQQMSETVWAKELLAQKCGLVFETLWDSLNVATNKLQLLAGFPALEFVLGTWNSRSLAHGIELYQSAGPGPRLSSLQWRHLIETFAHDGWQLETIEFRHYRFETDAGDLPRQSQFLLMAHLVHADPLMRATVEGNLGVDWLAQGTKDAGVSVKRIDASRLTLKTRRGEPPFQLLFTEQISPPEKSYSIDPLILYDLDGDGLSEIILAARNLVYRRRGENRYEPETFCRYPPGPITSGLIADFDGDGVADFLGAKPEGLWLFKGSPSGTFNDPGRPVWLARPPLENVIAMTGGDIDHDGDLDVFAGQYKVPTLGQALRPHYYDANDGYAANLFLNDGQGNFKEATLAAGLGTKRWRRSYSTSFVDLDGDTHLDLAVISDFAGVDLYRNDGHGHFSDVTAEWIAEPHAFGMAHVLADFNVDGRLDLLMIGMPSPTADRLEHLGLWRSDSTDDPSMRSRMTFGNRLYLARPQGGFEQTSLGDSMARSGWSWGASAFDFNNDGFPDVYLANGLQSQRSVRDYESEFWLHDIYVDPAVDDLTATAYFMAKYLRTRGQGWSYGGYEKNRLYLNQHGKTFIEVGHLMGVALEQDSRNVVTDDLNGDGRMDLLVTTLEVWPQVKQTLRVYLNTLKDGGHWIGFRFREQGGGNSPIGAQVTAYYSDHRAVRHLVTGDSHRSQHANTLHFGLGEFGQVDRVEIRWPNGQAITLNQPAVDCYHCLQAPVAPPVRR